MPSVNITEQLPENVLRDWVQKDTKHYDIEAFMDDYTASLLYRGHPVLELTHSFTALSPFVKTELKKQLSANTTAFYPSFCLFDKKEIGITETVIDFIMECLLRYYRFNIVEVKPILLPLFSNTTLLGAYIKPGVNGLVNCVLYVEYNGAVYSLSLKMDSLLFWVNCLVVDKGNGYPQAYQANQYCPYTELKKIIVLLSTTTHEPFDRSGLKHYRLVFTQNLEMYNPNRVSLSVTEIETDRVFEVQGNVKALEFLNELQVYSLNRQGGLLLSRWGYLNDPFIEGSSSAIFEITALNGRGVSCSYVANNISENESVFEPVNVRQLKSRPRY